MTHTSTIRTSLVAGALAAALIALPVAGVANAAPATVAPSTVVQGHGAERARAADPIVDEAVEALSVLRELRAAGPVAADAYAELRDTVAGAVAARVGIDPTVMQAAWQSADLDHQQALLAGLTQLGVPYRRNTSKPGQGFDCSGLTTYAWGQAGFTLTRQSGSQIREAASRTIDTAQAGDLVQYPGHVMMWLGVDRAVLHSPYTGRNVEVVVSSARRNLRFGDPTG